MADLTRQREYSRCPARLAPGGCGPVPSGRSRRGRWGRVRRWRGIGRRRGGRGRRWRGGRFRRRGGGWLGRWRWRGRRGRGGARGRGWGRGGAAGRGWGRGGGGVGVRWARRRRGVGGLVATGAGIERRAGSPGATGRVSGPTGARGFPAAAPMR